MNHELGGAAGVPRAHGGRGAFVSKWTVRKADLAVLSGADLGNQVVLWNTTTSSYDAPTTGVAFNRFCSADLPAPEALYDAESGLGFDGQLFFNGEENGNEGRAIVHGLDGKMWEAAPPRQVQLGELGPEPGHGQDHGRGRARRHRRRSGLLLLRHQDGFRQRHRQGRASPTASSTACA